MILGGLSAADETTEFRAAGVNRNRVVDVIALDGGKALRASRR
jgi:hypothetical protein